MRWGGRLGATGKCRWKGEKREKKKKKKKTRGRRHENGLESQARTV